MEIGSKNMIISVALVLWFTATFLTPLSDSKKCNPSDKKALLEIKKGFGDPYDIIQWDPQTDCCEDGWNGIECDESGRVNYLYVVDGDTLTGPISTEIGKLTRLEYILFVNCPGITGTIPSSIAKLRHLKDITVSGCNLSGPIPEFFGQMPTLDFISLPSNQLTGLIPSSIGNLPKLTGLRLDGNKLTGPIPDTFGNFKGEYFFLYLNNNRLSGDIPAQLGDKKDFAYVDLSRNRLECDASFLFGTDKKDLYQIDLSKNSLSFEFSDVKFPETLVYLDISGNKIYGALPEDLTKFAFQTFNVSYNRLCGKIPVGGRLQKFGASAYRHNLCLCGAPLPECLSLDSH